MLRANAYMRATGRGWQRLFASRGQICGCEKIHLRTANELRHESIGGVAIEINRRADLLHPARTHDDNFVGERHGLNLVMGHIDHGRLQTLVQTGNFQTGLYAQSGIQIGQGLIKQKHFGIANNCPANRHALTLPAR